MEQHNLLWLDLEMTGLYPEKEVILEVAAVVTDPTAIQYLSDPFHRILSCDERILHSMSAWCQEHHTKSGLIDTVRASSFTASQVDALLADFIRPYGQGKQFILCGNSVWQDRMFIRAYLPLTYALLHYRMIDVSSLKQLVRAWYPKHAESYYTKKDTHRAVDDLYESIHELHHYKKYFFHTTEVTTTEG